MNEIRFFFVGWFESEVCDIWLHFLWDKDRGTALLYLTDVWRFLPWNLTGTSAYLQISLKSSSKTRGFDIMWLIGERYIPPIFYSEFFSHIYLKLNSAVKESRWNFGEENLEVYLFFMCLCCVAWRYGLWGDRATLNNGGTGLTRTSVTGMCPPGPGTIHTYWGGKIPGATNGPAIIL